MNEGESTKDNTGVSERALALLKILFDHIGVGPLFSISSLIVALVAGKVAIYHFEATALLNQLSGNRTTYEHALSEMQNKIEERIPERVRSPLPIFPKNEISLTFPTKNSRTEMSLPNDI